MVVIFEGKLWELDMYYPYFKNLQEKSPELRVRIKHLTPSMHADEKKVSVGQLEASLRK